MCKISAEYAVSCTVLHGMSLPVPKIQMRSMCSRQYALYIGLEDAIRFAVLKNEMILFSIVYGHLPMG